jgi:hypothetical protein
MHAGLDPHIGKRVLIKATPFSAWPVTSSIKALGPALPRR